MNQAISDKILWPCVDRPEGSKLSDSMDRPKCVYLNYVGGRARCLKGNFVECGAGDFIEWMKTHYCPSINEEKRMEQIAVASAIQAASSKMMAKWSKISALIVFLWLVVAILNMFFPNGFK